MTTNLNKKSKNLTFLVFSAISAVGIIATILHSCKKEKLADKPIIQKSPTIKVKNTENEIVDNRRTIYLTFDDGPNHGTENLMKLINKHNIPVTEFAVGQHVFGSQKQKLDYEKLKNDSLFEIENHSYTHAANNKYSKFYENADEVIADFDRTKDSLKLKTNIARTPGRNIWRMKGIKSTDIKSSTEAADKLAKSYKIIGWDLEWRRTKDMKLKGTGDEMAKKIDSIFYNDLEKTSRHLVLLTHDQYLRDDNSVQKLDHFITKLKKSGRFQFKKISSYPKINEILD